MKNILALLLVLIFTTQSALAASKSFTIKSGVTEVESKYKAIEKPKISIKVKEVELKSYLKEYYLAYHYCIKNESKDNLYIVSSDFEKGINGGDAYLKVRQNADENLKKHIWQHVELGPVTWGLAWAYDFLRAPFFWFRDINRNKKMKREAIEFSKDKIFASDFDPNDYIEKLVLFPVDSDPYLRITFRQKSTGYLFTMVKQGFDKPKEETETPGILDRLKSRIFREETL